MNPFPVLFSMFHKQRLTLALFTVLVAFAVALGVAVTSQERALRQGSARAADKFELLVGAPGSQYDLVLSSVYLRLSSMELLSPDVFADLLAEPDIDWAAPIAFGDSAGGFPVIGSITQFITHLSGELAEGSLFDAEGEAVIGADVPYRIGESFRTLHGAPGAESEVHEHEIAVVGRMMPTGTPWDRAIIVPVETMWEQHGLPNGHLDTDEDEHDHAEDADGQFDAHGEDGHDEDNDPEEVGHDHEHAGPIGPPFDAEALPGVPAVVVKARDLAAAYGLRNTYRTSESQALFPAEILVQLYALMGDARGIVQWLAMATQVLVVAAVLSGLVVIQQLHTTRLAILRALGASRAYVFVTVWLYFTLLIAGGAVLGLLLGYGAALLVSAYVSELAGFTLTAILGPQEFGLVGGLLLIGALLALVPAIALFRRPVVDALRQ
ncbi:MAG: FtsX-like permease family protein [Alphaproteobacteria bacterium]|nr:FtsX-like permease family protein [Alphaproteobacteria bacterium]